MLAVAVEIKRPANLPVVGDSLGAIDLIEQTLGVHAQAQFVGRIGARLIAQRANTVASG